MKTIGCNPLIFSFPFLLSTAWNIANDLKMVAANGALESVSVDGVSQVQVMIMQTFNTLILIFPVLSFKFHSYCIGGFQIIVEYEWENETHEQWSFSVLPSYFLSSIKVPTENLCM